MNFDSVRFGSGRPGNHDELAALVQGRGTFTDDIAIDAQLHACFVRSVQAHARIRRIDAGRARALPGVHAVITGKDMQDAGLGVIPPLAVFNGRDGNPMAIVGIPPLVYDTVRYVGEAVAVVIAESPGIAMSAAELVDVDLETLPVLVTMDQALAADARRIHPQLPSNVALDWEDGDAEVSAAAFACAHHIESVELDDPPLAACALEPRSAIAQWDPNAQRYTLITGTQGVMVVRKLLAENVFKIALDKLRVITPDVGGGFGAKVQTYSEYAAILHASKVVGRPVKWTASRLESFLADTHGRNSSLKAEMAFDKNGKILGIRTDVMVGIGAYPSTYVAIIATNNIKNCLSSVYRTPSIRMRSRLIFTNTMPLGPYRGAGRPEAIYMIERLLDRASQALAIDRVELRRRNLIPAAAMPYSAPNGQIYDSGEFETVMDKALVLSDWKGFDVRRAESQRRGLLRGIGICCFLEVSGGILDEPAELRFSDDGALSIHVGAQALGQGHLSTFSRLVADRLGIDVRHVRLVAGDSDQTPGLVATVASRSMMMAGSASVLACDEAIRRGKAIAAYLLEASIDDIEFGDGVFHIVGTDRILPILDIPSRLRSLQELPENVPSSLNNLSKFTSPTMSFPNGCHVCEVEIDPETGITRIIQHTAVDDVGVILNQEVVNGQITGGVAQGLGQVLGEQLRYDDDGQLRSASFMDYPILRADSMPAIAMSHHVVPCRNNPLGVKGAGESGVAGTLPSATNAILHALSLRGVTQLDLPFTPERVWAALSSATK